MLDEGCGVRPRGAAMRRARRLGQPTRFVLFAWDPIGMRTLYHSRGTLLGAVLRSEALAAEVYPPRLGATVRVDRMASAAGFRAAWRKALTAAGVAPSAIPRLMQAAVEPHRANFTARLRAHMAHPAFHSTWSGARQSSTHLGTHADNSSIEIIQDT